VSSRPTIADLAKAAGVSVATVDRVLNQRHPVRDGTAERVLRAAETIGFHATALIRQRLREGQPARTLGFLLQRRDDVFYRQLGTDLAAATRQRADIRGKPVVDYIDELSPAVIAQRIAEMGARVDALAVVSVDHPHVSLAIERLKERGVPVFAIISDLTAESRAAYIGHDNRKEGRTAAWIIANTAKKPGKVGIIVGTHRYLCQETAEISFRSYFREHATEFRLLEPLVNLEDARIAHEATLDMMEKNPDLVGLYICGGGMDGVIEAAREEATHDPVVVVCNELTEATRSGLIDGILSAVISTRTVMVAERTVEAMARVLENPTAALPPQIFVPFDLFIAENI
jgi:LacI family transcriptional regulator